VHYFHDYKALYEAEQLKVPEDRVEPSWAPPRPTIEECVLDLINLFDGPFAQPKFQSGVERCFRSTGCMHDGSLNFVEFKYESAGGTFAIAPLGTVEVYSKKADIVSQLELATNEVFDLMLDGDDDDDD